jgi:hypothetical protein
MVYVADFAAALRAVCWPCEIGRSASELHSWCGVAVCVAALRAAGWPCAIGTHAHQLHYWCMAVAFVVARRGSMYIDVHVHDCYPSTPTLTLRCCPTSLFAPSARRCCPGRRVSPPIPSIPTHMPTLHTLVLSRPYRLYTFHTPHQRYRRYT